MTKALKLLKILACAHTFFLINGQRSIKDHLEVLLKFCPYSNECFVVARLVECVSELVELLVAHTELEMSETLAEEAEELSVPPLRVRGCAVTAVERLDDEFIKLLKECDPHSNEYVDR